MNDAYSNQLPDMHHLYHDLYVEQQEERLRWKPIESAPKDGRTIEFNYGTIEKPEIALVFWSERPVCMGGPTVYNKPGWATAPASMTDTNLPMDAAELWREY